MEVHTRAAGARPFALFRAVILAGAVIAAAAACEDSSLFLTASERDELYGLDLLVSDATLSDGAIILPGTGIAARVALADGVSTPVGLSLVLLDAGGYEIARTDYLQGEVPAAAAGDPQTPIELGRNATVGALLGGLPAVTVPADLEPGRYLLELSATGTDGSEVAAVSREIFLAASKPAAPVLSILPGVAKPGSMLLLVAESDPGYPDAWGRWSSQGAVLSEGKVSDGFDRLLWRTPVEPAASSIEFEWFPFPPARKDFGSPVIERISVLVPGRGAAASDEFDDSEGFAALYRLEGDFSEALGRAESRPRGRALPDAWSGGLGFRFRTGEGFDAPVGELAHRAFALVARVDLDADPSGVIASFGTDAGRMAVSAVDGLLAIELPGQDALVGPPAPGRPFTVAASFLPLDSGTFVSLSVDGKVAKVFRSPLDPSAWPSEGSLEVGGASGFYDAAGLWVPPDGVSAYPAWARRTVASRSSQVLVAEGFESPVVPATFVPDDSIASTGEGLEIGAGATARLVAEFDPAERFRVSWDGSATLVAFDGHGSTLCSIDREGAVRVPGADSPGTLDPSAGFVFSLDGGRLAVSSGDASPIRIPTAETGSDLRISFGFKAGGGGSTLRRLAILRDATAYASGK